MKTTHRLLITAALAALIGLPSTAMAQDLPPAGPIGKQFDKYWASKREVRNIHKRLFLKDGRWEFAIGGGIIPNDDFWVYYPLGGKINYYFSEDLALELAGAYMLRSNSELEEFLESEIYGGDILQVELPQWLVWQAGAGALWTPLHGKVGIFDTKLGHFDFGLALGVMVLGTQVKAEGQTEDEAAGRIDVGGNVGATVRFYVADFVAVRIDYRHYFYNARDADDNSRGLSFPAEISLSVSFFTPAPN